MIDNNLLVGVDGKLYVKKVVGNPDKPLFEAIVPASEADLPQDRIAGPSMTLKHLPKLSMKTVMFVHAYFRAVYEKYKSEAIVFFHRYDDDPDYTVVIPESFSASGASLDYEHSQPVFCTTCNICSESDITDCPRCGTPTMIKTKIMGTAHSHGSMPAFHSGTDDAHEKNQTGFHITFGNVNSSIYTLCPSFVVAMCGHVDSKGHGIRYTPELSDLVEVPTFPLAPAERTRISLWLTALFTKERLAAEPDANFVVCEARKNYPLLCTPNKEFAERWCSKQPASRGVEILTVSQAKARLYPTPSYKSYQGGYSHSGGVVTPTSHMPVGQIPAMGHTVGGSLQHPTSTAIVSGTSVIGGSGVMVPNKTETLMSGSDAGINIGLVPIAAAVEIKSGADVYSVQISIDDQCDIKVNGRAFEAFEVIDGLGMTSYNNGVFMVWATIYALHEIATGLDDMCPLHTPQMSSHYDKLIEGLKTTIDDHIGDSVDAAEGYLSEYRLKSDNSGASGSYDTLIQKSVKRVISVVEANRSATSDFDKVVAAQFVLLEAVIQLLDIAARYEVLADKVVDTIADEVTTVQERLLVELMEDATVNVS